MPERIIEWSLRNRFLVLVLATLLVVLGLRAMLRLPVDAVPDVTNVQVQVLTNAPALGPLEVEQFITFPVESAMSGLPDVTEVRSVSRFGLSAVTVVFEEGTDIYLARQLVAERLREAAEQIPERYGSPAMGPISTGLGEIYQFEVRGAGYTAMELRSVLDWIIAYNLRTVPGVVEVNTFGGELKTYSVQLDPQSLVAYDVGLDRIVEALQENNANAGGAYIERRGEQVLLRGEGLVGSRDDIAAIVVKTGPGGTPVTIGDVGEVDFEPMVRQGAVTRDGRGEAVVGIVMMLLGENSRVVVDRVQQRVDELRDGLPPGVTIDTFYDRTELIRRTIRTVEKNLLEGGLLVIAVLLLTLGNLRGGLIVSSIIPLSMLVAFIAMVEAGVSGNLMSLGAIDFGIIVDGSVVVVENTVRKLAHRDPEIPRIRVVRDAAVEVARPVAFAVGIIMVVFLPIFTLTGIEGKMFRPMAFTLLAALAGALVLAFTLVPVLVHLVLRGSVGERETLLIRWVRRIYEPFLARCARHPVVVVASAAGAFLLSLALVPFLGAEFAPKLDEGAVAIQAWRLPSVSLEESIRATTRIEEVLMEEIPEVETVVSKTGKPEIATDPMGVEISDIFVILKPHGAWRAGLTKEALLERMDDLLQERLPGQLYSYSQPIELRVSELIAGVRSDVAIKVFGADMEVLRGLGDEIAAVLREIPGGVGVKAEQVSGLPVLRVRVDREETARLGVDGAEILETVEAVGGMVVGDVFEGRRRFPLQIRFREMDRDHVEDIATLPVRTASGAFVPLRQLAEITLETGPAQISREAAQRKLTVEANVRGRDLAGFVSEARDALRAAVDLPPGYFLDWGGQFENLERASGRLAIVVPVALLLIFVFLFTTFGSARLALLIFLNVPMATTGGILALALRGYPFSISAGVGFIALFGVAVLNGIVLVSYAVQRRREGRGPRESALDAAKIRLRPVLMTAMVASFGFLPMALSHSAGAEVQRPLATVVIGGLVTSTFLTLVVLPVLYPWFVGRKVEF